MTVAVAAVTMTVAIAAMAVAVTICARLMAVAVVVIMAAHPMMVVATKDKQIQDVDCNASQGQEEHELAIDRAWVHDAMHCFCYQDACHCPAA